MVYFAEYINGCVYIFDGFGEAISITAVNECDYAPLKDRSCEVCIHKGSNGLANFQSKTTVAGKTLFFLSAYRYDDLKSKEIENMKITKNYEVTKS